MNLSCFPSLDPRLVGKKIARGGHHDVYEYDKDKVLKIPHRPFRFLYSDKHALLKDLALIQKYFPDLLVNTEIVESVKKKRHVILQTRVKDFEFLTKKNSVLVYEQLQDVVKRNRILHAKERMSLDFLGGQGYVSYLSSLFFRDSNPHFSNMVVMKEGKKHSIRLVDTELLRLSPPTFTRRSMTIYFLSLISWWINKLVFRWDFGMKL